MDHTTRIIATTVDFSRHITNSTTASFLHKSDIFKFSTFGFPVMTCTVEESEAPESNGRPGRLAWRVKTDEGFEVYHAWLVEDLEGQRVRILTQESQIGSAFTEMESKKPNIMLLGHQDWLDGLITAAKGGEVRKSLCEMGVRSSTNFVSRLGKRIWRLSSFLRLLGSDKRGWLDAALYGSVVSVIMFPLVEEVVTKGTISCV